MLWSRLVSSSPEIHGAFAEVDGIVVGFAHFHFHRSTWTPTWHCYLEDLYVDERFRGRGLASSLIHEVRRAALQRQCSELFWITREGNFPARRLNDRLATVTDFVRYEVSLEATPETS